MKRIIINMYYDEKIYTYDIYAKNITSALNQIKKMLKETFENFEIISIQEDC